MLESLLTWNRLTRWLSAFIAAWWSLKLLQSKESDAFIDKAPSTSGADDVVAIKSTKFAGRTMDLTLFAVIRAVDVLFGELWEQQKLRKKGTGHWTRVRSLPLSSDLFNSQLKFLARHRHLQSH